VSPPHGRARAPSAKIDGVPDTGPGGELVRRYQQEVVGPLLARHRPDLRYAAGRLGSGSDVLGFDDRLSRDHDWGLRLTLLVDDDRIAGDVDELLAERLPESFAGHPVRFSTTWDPAATHKVHTASVTTFVASRLGLDPARLDDPSAWLALTGQSVLEVTAGPVFRDDVGQLTLVRNRLAWYPDDVWLYVVASGWQRLGQELPMVGRCGDLGDDLGSRIIAGRLARDVMHLGCLIERAWPPYPKWLGHRFGQLPVATTAGPALAAALTASGWRQREAALAEAATVLHDRQRTTGLPAVAEPIIAFWDRPYRTVNGDLVAALAAAIGDRTVASLPLGIGSVEQWVDSVDVLARPERRVAAAALWREGPASAR
jgi:Domain of unknown function (DUF4037)